jgi:nitrogen fixation-related uncharacterized protein
MGTDLTERTRTRKAISILLGICLVVAGLYGFFYMFAHVSEPVKILYWLAPTSIFAAGVAVLWDDLKNG